MHINIFIWCFALASGFWTAHGLTNRRDEGIVTYETCTEPTGTFLPVEGSCKDYYLCINDELILFTCGDGNYLYTEGGYCKQDTEYVCNIRPTTVEPTTEAQYSCSSEPSGISVPIDGECYKYNLCMDGISIPQECPRGLLFSDELRYCILDTEGTCWDLSTTTKDDSTTGEDSTTTDESTTTAETTITQQSTTTEVATSTTDQSTTTEVPTTTGDSTTTEGQTTTDDSTTTEVTTTTEVSTTTEVPTTTEALTTTTEVPITTEDSTTTEVTTTTEISTTTEDSTTTEETTTTEVSTTTEDSTTTEVPTTTEVSTTTEVPTTTEDSTTTEVTTTTEDSTTSEVTTTAEVSTTTEGQATTEDSTTTEVTITTEVSTTTEVPTTTEDSTTTEALTTTTEVPATTDDSTTTEVTTTEVSTTTEDSTTTEVTTTTEALTTTTEVPTTTEDSTSTEVTTTTEDSTTTEVTTTTEQSTTTEVTTTTEESTTTEQSTTTEVPTTTTVSTTTTEVTIPTTSDNVCEGVELGTVPHADCDKFYICMNEVDTIGYCSEGDYFDQSLSQCMPDVNGVCWGRCVSSPTGTRFPDVDDCQWYFECQAGDEYSISCQDGYYFDSTTLECIEDVDNICGSTSPTVCQDQADGTIIPHGECGSYYVCINTEAEVRSCDVGYRFDAQQTECVSDPTFSCFCELNTEGVLPGSACNEYYKCDNGVASIQNCPEGEYFAPTALGCTIDENATCLITLSTTTVTP